MNTIQLRPTYPTTGDVAKRQANAHTQRCQQRNMRRQLFIDTELVNMHLSYAEYEKFLEGHTYESIAYKQHIAYHTRLVQREAKAFEVVQELYRWKNMLNETGSYYMRRTAKDKCRLSLRVAQAVGRWRCLCAALTRYY